MKEKKPDAIIFIGADGDDAIAIEKAAKTGLKTIVVEPDPQARGVELADKHVKVSPGDARALISELDHLSTKFKFRAVLCFTAAKRDVTRGRIAARYGLPGPKPEAVETCLSRFETFKKLKEAGVQIPEYGTAETLPEASDMADKLGYPIIVYSMSHDAGSPARLCEDEDDLHIIFHAYPGNPFSGKLLLEHVVEGTNIILPGLVTRGRLMPLPNIEKHYLIGEALLPESYTVPVELEEAQERAILPIARRAIDVLGLDHTAVTIQMTSAQDKPYITGLLPNISMDLAAGLIPCTCGVDLVSETIRLSLGQVPNLRSTKSELGMTSYFYPGKAGQINSISGADSLDVRGIHEVSFLAPGTDVWEPVSFYDHIGKVVLSAPTKLVLETLKKQVRDTIRISVK